jgi:multidrug efflux pump subunit AcrB
MDRRHRHHLNEYAITYGENDDGTFVLEVEGPDEAVSRQIGQRFQEMVKHEDGFQLWTGCLMTSMPEIQQQAEAEVIERLGVPPADANESSSRF